MLVLDSSASGQVTVAGCFETGNKPSICVKFREVLGWLVQILVFQATLCFIHLFIHIFIGSLKSNISCLSKF